MDAFNLAREDPLISDYLTMETSAGLNSDHFDDYPASDRTNGTCTDLGVCSKRYRYVIKKVSALGGNKDM